MLVLLFEKSAFFAVCYNMCAADLDKMSCQYRKYIIKTELIYQLLLILFNTITNTITNTINITKLLLLLL